MHTLCSIITVRKISKIDATRCHILELKCTFSEGMENGKGRGKLERGGTKRTKEGRDKGKGKGVEFLYLC